MSVISRARRLFSEYIVKRDGECVVCRKAGTLQCSHFHNSWKNSVRWDPDNAVAMCPECHAEYEGRKKTAFSDLMLARLGREKFDALNQRAETIVKEKEAARMFLEWMRNKTWSLDLFDDEGNPIFALTPDEVCVKALIKLLEGKDDNKKEDQE